MFRRAFFIIHAFSIDYAHCVSKGVSFEHSTRMESLNMTAINSVNLKHITFFNAKKLAKELSGKTNEELAEEINMGHEHVARHFRDPHYNIGTPMMPALCLALGNKLMIQWQCVQVGGYYGEVDPAKKQDMSVDVQMSCVCKETADVMSTWAATMMDGKRTLQEDHRMDQELSDLIRKADECRVALRLSRGVGR